MADERPAEPETLVRLGVVARPHGVRGELRVHRYNPDSTLLEQVEELWLFEATGPRAVAVEGVRRHGAFTLFWLAGVVGREAADALRGTEVGVPRDLLPPPEDDEVYHVDLIGSAVVDEAGEDMGTVVDVLRYPSVDCLLVRAGDEEREVPVLEPYFVRAEEGRVVLAHLADFEPRRRRRPR